MNVIGSIDGLGLKACSKCGVPKELSEFRRQKSSKDGCQTQCKMCVKKCYENNKQYYADRNSKWRKENPGYGKKHYESNKKYYTEYQKKWQKLNPDRCQSISAKRRSTKLQASPSWMAGTGKAQMQEFYTLATKQSEKTGKAYHVDHIHPLNHHLICGLHVPANLQILEASINLSKHNNFEPYIESECGFTELWQVRSNDRTLIPTPIDRIPRRYPRAFIKLRKSKGVSKGQLALF